MAISLMMRRLGLSGSFMVLGFMIVLGASPIAQASTDPAFTCQAVAISRNGTPLGTAFINPSPACAPKSATQNNLNLTTGGFTVTATELQASIFVGSRSVSADASLKNLKITFVDNGKTNTITADTVTSEATGACANGSANLSSNNTFPNLMVNGQSPTTPSAPLLGGGILRTNVSFTEGTQASAVIKATALQIVSANFQQSLAVAFTSIHADCTPGVPPPGGGPIPPAGERPSWLLWGALFTALGLIGLSSTLFARRRGVLVGMRHRAG